jgi:NAD(P)-dependent dehydrogenase (short-subunit alcohol dehydrogenase family)
LKIYDIAGDRHAKRLSEAAVSEPEAADAWIDVRNEPPADHGETSYKGSGRLQGMKAVITGGDKRHRTRAYAREGADILIAYLSEKDDADEVKALIEQGGGKAVLVAGDLQDPDHCRSVIKRAVAELGGIDILVNNAAHQATFNDVGDISDEEWEMTFKVNIHAMFYLTKAPFHT